MLIRYLDRLFSILLHQAKQPGFTSTAMFTATGFQHPPSFYPLPHFQSSSLKLSTTTILKSLSINDPSVVSTKTM